MGLVSEFREFIIKGNAVDMAVGIIVGAAFGAVVKSLVDNIMMPPLGYLMGGIDFSSWQWVIAEAVPKGGAHPVTKVVLEKDLPEVALKYGVFINSLINLVIQGVAIFAVVKLINTLRRKNVASPVAPAPPADVQLLTEIRDLLKAR